MKPILFPKNATTFTSNGLGTLDFTECLVTEVKNSEYSLEGTMTADSLHASQLEIESIIGAVPCDGGNVQAFRVAKIIKKSNGLYEISAPHISSDLHTVGVMPCQGNSAQDAMSAMKTNSVGINNFTFWSNVTTLATYTQKTPAEFKNRLCGERGSVLDTFGGEFEWDNYQVKLYRWRGSQSPVTSIMYGKNLIDLSQEEKIENVITGVIPFWIDSDDDTSLVVLPEKAVYSSSASLYAHSRIIPLDLSNEYENKPSVADIRAYAQAYVNKSNFALPDISIKIKFADLRKYEKDVNPDELSHVKLCDYINVYFTKLGISRTAEIVKTVYNVLEDRYESIEVGTLKRTLATVLNDQEASMVEMLEDAVTTTRREINNATAWLTSGNGYVVAIKNPDGSWKELLFMDTNSTQTARKVLRINENGIGFSTTGVNGNYTNAWTIDGVLVADFIKSGTLSGITINAGGSNNQNGVMYVKDANGNNVITLNVNGITVTKGSISGSTIVVGGNNNTSGTITVKDASNNDAVVLNSSGITVNKGSITGSTITAGGNNNASGTITVNDLNNTVIVQMTNSGLVVKKGTIEGASIKIGGQNNQSGTITMLDSSGNTMGYWNNAELNVGNGATKLGSQNIQTKWLDCATANGEAWFPNGIYINRSGNGKFEGRSFAVNTWDNQNGGMIEAYQDGIITITRDLYVAGTIRNSSDIRLKTNVKPLKNSIELIKKMHPISFKTIDDTEHTRHGLIAQDFDELSNYGEWLVWCETDDGYQELAYMELIADIIEVEQEILKRLEDIEEKLKKGDD